MGERTKRPTGVPYVTERRNANGTKRLYWQRSGYPLVRLPDGASLAELREIVSGLGAPRPRQSPEERERLRRFHEPRNEPWAILRSVIGPGSDLAAITHVYFIQCGLSGRIKIGQALNPLGRLVEPQVGSPSDLRLLIAVEAPTFAERHLHQHFDELRLHGEWFAPGARLVDFVQALMLAKALRVT